MKNNIYSATSQALNEKFKEVGDNSKILIVPIDYSKTEHIVQFCLADGSYLLKKTLIVFNSLKGAEFLKTKIMKMCKKLEISKFNVILVVEDPPAYVKNFIFYFKDKNFSFFRVNAGEASTYRKSSMVSSDKRDLDGITQCVINRKVYEILNDDKYYFMLKKAIRSRRLLVKLKVQLKNQIHDIIDMLMPGFLDVKTSLLTPFGNASLELMKDNFSSVKIKRMHLNKLTNKLKKYKVHNPKKIAKNLIELAKRSLKISLEDVENIQKILLAKVKLLEGVEEEIFIEEEICARILVRIPGIYLLSIPGLGVVLTSMIIAELGPPNKWLELNNMAAYGGIVPRVKQTGGSMGNTFTLGLSHKCNKILKDALLQAAMHVGTTLYPPTICKYFNKSGKHFLYEHFQKVKLRDGHCRLSTAKLLLKIIRKMVLDRRYYFPEKFHYSFNDGLNLENKNDYIIFYQKTLENIKDKLAPYNLKNIPEEESYLKYEEEMYNAILKELKSNNKNH